jgi:hypothetical protein
MKLFVTLGMTDGYKEIEVDVPDGTYVKYMGLEMENLEKEPIHRETIVRMPFNFHDGTRIIHTMCHRNDEEVTEVTA